MKYIIAFFALSACGVWAAGAQNNLRFADNTAPETEKSSDKNSANSDGTVDSYNQPAYTDADDTASERPDSAK